MNWWAVLVVFLIPIAGVITARVLMDAANRYGEQNTAIVTLTVCWILVAGIVGVMA